MPGSASELTLEEQIGQILMVGFAGTTPTPEIRELIQRYHVALGLKVSGPSGGQPLPASVSR